MGQAVRTVSPWRGLRWSPQSIMAESVRAGFWGINDDAEDRRYWTWHLSRVPSRFHGKALSMYRATMRDDSRKAANLALAELSAAFSGGGIDLAANDEQIRELAERRATFAQGVVMRESRPAVKLAGLLAYCASCGVPAPTLRRVPEFDRPGHTLSRWQWPCANADYQAMRAACDAAMVARICCPRWWRRQLRTTLIRRIEAAAIRLGMVHRRASVYASDEAHARRRGQVQANARALAAQEIQNQDGVTLSLADVSAVNVSNPEIRRAELMTRLRGFQDFAKGAGHVGLFYTITAPSRMHARLAKTGARNPKYDGTTPRQAQAHLCREWARARAWLARRQVPCYGIRVVEPHHDGCPHWHLLLWTPAACAQQLTECLQAYATRADAGELASDEARQARFKAVLIDEARGGAVAYVSKYIAKNIDAYRVGADDEAPEQDRSETVSRVEAWAATWGIRQFQQVGGPSVTVWRELRRLREPQQLPLFDDFRAAADAGNWRRYFELQRGQGIARRDRPLQLWRLWSDKATRYGDVRGLIVEGVRRPMMREHCRTRFDTWKPSQQWAGIQRDSAPQGAKPREARAARPSTPDNAGAAASGAFALPWTRGNNCTRWGAIKRALQPAAAAEMAEAPPC